MKHVSNLKPQHMLLALFTLFIYWKNIALLQYKSKHLDSWSIRSPLGHIYICCKITSTLTKKYIQMLSYLHTHQEIQERKVGSSGTCNLGLLLFKGLECFYSLHEWFQRHTCHMYMKYIQYACTHTHKVCIYHAFKNTCNTAASNKSISTSRNVCLFFFLRKIFPDEGTSCTIKPKCLPELKNMFCSFSRFLQQLKWCITILNNDY